MTSKVICMAIKLAIKDEGQVRYLTNLMNEPGQNPSRSTLQRNRLTVLMGYARHLQVVSKVWDQCPGGYVKWGSQDLTPSLGREWLRSVCTECKVVDLEKAVELA